MVNDDDDDLNDVSKENNDYDHEDSGPLLSKQLMAATSVSLLSATLGASFAFSGIVGPQLTRPEDSNTKLDSNMDNLSHNLSGLMEKAKDHEVGDRIHVLLTQAQLSWFASLIILGLIPSSLVGGFIGHHYGRMRVMRLVTPLLVVALLTQTLAQHARVLLAARLAQGLAIGLLGVPASIYIAEISSAKWRATLLSTMDLFIKMGSLLTFILGSLFHWRLLSMLVSVVPLVSLLCFWLVLPESPVWCMHQGRIEEASKALRWFHPSSTSSSTELSRLLESTRHSRIERRSSLSSSLLSWWSLKSRLRSLFVLAGRRDVHRPFSILLLLFALQQLSGRIVIPFYAVAVFVDTAKAINEYVATILFGLTSFVGQVLNLSLLLVLRRRQLLAMSAIIMGLAMSTLAIIVSIENEEMGNSRSFMALSAVLALGVGYQIGLGPIPWALCSELYPSDVRSLLSGLTQAIAQILMFLVVKMFPGLKNTLGLATVFAFFAFDTVLVLIFALTIMPETKNVRLEHVANAFKDEDNDNDTTNDTNDLNERKL